jgi:ankyrin repeat protein
MEITKLNELLENACKKKDLQLFRELVSTHCDSNYSIYSHSYDKEEKNTYRGSCPLIVLASEWGFTQGVELLLQNNVGVNEVAKYSKNDTVYLSYSPLQIAARKGYIDIVKKLIEHGANVAFENYISLVESAKMAHSEILVYLIGFLEVNTNNNYKLLSFALESSIWNYVDKFMVGLESEKIKEKEFIKVVNLLLSSGADITLAGLSEIIREPKLNNLFYYLKDQHIKIHAFINLNKRELIQSAFNNLAIIEFIELNYQDIVFDEFEFYLFLCGAIGDGNVKVVEKILLQYKKIDINKSPLGAKSFLALATTTGNAEIVELLIKFGADVNKSDGLDKTPIIHISFIESRFIKDAHYKIVDILISHGANVNSKMPYKGPRERLNGATALEIAKLFNREKFADFLISRGGKRYPTITLYELLDGLEEDYFPYYILKKMDLNSLIKLERLMTNKNNPSYITYANSIVFDYYFGTVKVPISYGYENNIVNLLTIMKRGELNKIPPPPNWIKLKLDSLNQPHVGYSSESVSLHNNVGFDYNQRMWVWSSLDEYIRSLPKDK